MILKWLKFMKRLLLISNSTLFGSGYLDHCEDEIIDFLGKKIKTVVFIPYARPSGISHDEYTKKARERFLKLGYKLISVHEVENSKKLIEESEAIFIGGGNTFVLLDGLYANGLIEPIRKKVNSGTPYIGTSAGSNVACPTIMTTNDMPIKELKSFKALNLFPYQINPHYLDPDPSSTHQGETRETRIKEYLCFNNTSVIGLREGAMIRVEDDQITLKGSTGAKIFKKNIEPFEISSGDKITDL